MQQHNKVEKPYRLSLIESNIPVEFKTSAMKKINILDYMDPSSGEYYKIKQWVDTFMRIPFNKTKNLFKKRGLILNWKEFEKLDQVQQINTISMIAPISNEEKQKLLEAISIGNKTKTLLEILEFYLYNNSSEKMTIQ